MKDKGNKLMDGLHARDLDQPFSGWKCMQCILAMQILTQQMWSKGQDNASLFLIN